MFDRKKWRKEYYWKHKKETQEKDKIYRNKNKNKIKKQCFHFSNLQPMWAEENLAKGAK